MNITDSLIEEVIDEAAPAEMLPEDLERCLLEGDVRFKDLVEAASKYDEPHVILVIYDGKIQAWENCSEQYGNSVEDLTSLAAGLAHITAGMVAERLGDAAAYEFVGRLTAAALG
jgi:hypothetical protein